MGSIGVKRKSFVTQPNGEIKEEEISEELQSILSDCSTPFHYEAGNSFHVRKPVEVYCARKDEPVEIQQTVTPTHLYLTIFSGVNVLIIKVEKHSSNVLSCTQI